MALAEEPRWYWIAYSAALGGVMAAASLIGGQPWLALFSFILLTGFGIVTRRWNESARWKRSSTDERQQRINAEGQLFAGQVLLFAILGGALWEFAHGYTGPFVALSALGGASFALGEFLARRRL